MDISKDRLKQIIKEEVDHAHTSHNYNPSAQDHENYEWASVVAHLKKIHDLSAAICESMQEPEDVEEWIQEKVAVISAMLHSIQHYQEEEKVRTD